MSADGYRIVIGEIYNQVNGHLRVYELENGMWIQVGSDIDSESGDALIGFSVAISSDGSRIAAGSGRNLGNGESRGLVRAFMAPNTPSVPSGGGPYSLPSWYAQLSDNFVGTNLQRCRKRKDTPPPEGKRCQRKAKTCFFGGQLCPNGVGPHPVTRCFCDGGKGDDQVWTCGEVECPSSSTDPIV